MKKETLDLLTQREKREGIDTLFRGKIDKFTFQIFKHNNEVKIWRTGPRWGGKRYSYHVDDFPKFLDNYGGELPENVVFEIEQDAAIYRL